MPPPSSGSSGPDWPEARWLRGTEEEQPTNRLKTAATAGRRRRSPCRRRVETKPAVEMIVTTEFEISSPTTNAPSAAVPITPAARADCRRDDEHLACPSRRRSRGSARRHTRSSRRTAAPRGRARAAGQAPSHATAEAVAHAGEDEHPTAADAKLLAAAEVLEHRIEQVDGEQDQRHADNALHDRIDQHGRNCRASNASSPSATTIVPCPSAYIVPRITRALPSHEWLMAPGKSAVVARSRARAANACAARRRPSRPQGACAVATANP